MIAQEIIDKYVTALYGLLLKREPDKEGFEHFRAFLADAGLEGFSRALESFVDSTEFKSLYIPWSNNSLEQCRGFDFSALDESVLDALFKKTSTYWRTFASSPEEIYWSVLTSDRYRGVLSEDVISEFLSTGSGDVRRIMDICKKIEFEFDKCSEFLDYGCGVGRLAVNLPESIEKIHCVDFSAAHLAEARENLRKAKPTTACEFHKIDTLCDLSGLPKNQDIVHSIIVLQHNTPPVIEKTVDLLLQLLAAGGIAILHIPIAKAYYQFDAQAYLADERSGQSMEMHILPKANIYQVARQASCDIVDSFCIGACGDDIYSEILVFRKEINNKI